MALGVARARRSTASASSAWRTRITSAGSATGPSSASTHGLVSIHFVNVLSRPIVAPFGGRDARLGTNPFCVGIPRPGGEPIVLDFATSKIAQGKTRVAYNKGVAGRARHADRRPRRADDRPALHRGRADRRAAAVRRAQGRGPGADLRAARRRARRRRHRRAPSTDGRRRVLNSMFSILVDPERLGTAANLAREMEGFVAYATASPPQRRASTASRRRASRSARCGARGSPTAFRSTR